MLSALSKEETLLKYYSKLEDEEKIILYSLGVLDNVPIRSKTKLQKLLFLLSNVFEDYADLLNFEPHLCGPYSERADDLLEDLIKLDLVQHSGNQFSLTGLGVELYERLHPKKELLDVLADYKSFLNDLSEDELLTFIYVTYPNTISEAIKWEQLKKNRVSCALKMLKKSKIGFAKAVEIANMPYNDFSLLVKNEGIRWKV